jgi:hypothetical protein
MFEILLISFKDHHRHKNPHKWLAGSALMIFLAPSSSNVRTGLEMNVGDGSLELKPALINVVQQSSFCGNDSEDANAHLQHFLEIYSTFTIRGVTQDVVCLHLFPFSLLGKTKQWFYSNKEAVST